MNPFRTLRFHRSFWALAHKGVNSGYLRLQDKYPVTQTALRNEFQEVIGVMMSDERSLRLINALDRKVAGNWLSGKDMGSFQELVVEYVNRVFPVNRSTNLGLRLKECVARCAKSEVSTEVVVTVALIGMAEDLSALVAA